MREPRADGTADHRASATAPAAVPARRGGRGGGLDTAPWDAAGGVHTPTPKDTAPARGCRVGRAPGPLQVAAGATRRPQRPVDRHRRRPRRGMSRPPHRHRLSPAAHRHDPGTVTAALRGAPGGRFGHEESPRRTHTRARTGRGHNNQRTPARPNPARSPRWRPGGGVGAAAGAGPSANPPRAAALRNSTRHPRNTPRQPRGSQPETRRCAGARRRTPAAALRAARVTNRGPMAACSDPMGASPAQRRAPNRCRGTAVAIRQRCGL